MKLLTIFIAISISAISFASTSTQTCHDFLATEFEDGATYYSGFAATVLKSLNENQMGYLAEKLEEDVVITGQRNFGAHDCKVIETVESCLQMNNMEFEDGASYYQAIHKLIILPLEGMGQNTLAKYLSSSLVEVGFQDFQSEVCESVASAIY